MSIASYLDGALHALFEGPGRTTEIDEVVESADRARDRRDWVLAANAYTAAISLDATRAGLKVQLGHALKEMDDFAGAERMYREFLEDHPEDADIHLQLGHLFNKKGDLATALTFYEQAQMRAPEDTEIGLHVESARRNAGRTDVVCKRNTAMELISGRRWDEALTLLRSLVANDGEKDLIGVLANVTKEVGRLDEAAALYDCYLVYARNSGNQRLVEDCHMQLGHLHKIKGESTTALTHFLDARAVKYANHENDLDESEVDDEIVACLTEIYPCFVFRPDNQANY